LKATRLKYEKAGLAPAFLFVRQAHSGAANPFPQQTVDGLWGTLEIRARSSYVPSFLLAFDPGFRKMRA
jgi:hypothetical protein